MNATATINGASSTAAPEAASAAVPVRTDVRRAVDPLETFFAPAISAGSSRAESIHTGDAPVVLVASNASPANVGGADNLIGALVGIFISNGDEPGETAVC